MLAAAVRPAKITSVIVQTELSRFVSGSPAITTGTPLQVKPQPVAVEDRVTEVRPSLAINTAVPAVGAFPQKVAEVRRLLANA